MVLLLIFSFPILSQKVRIGKQVWQDKNLDVAFFQNGDPIPQARTQEEWVRAIENEEPAWCYYDNDSTLAETNGKLYNWYAINDKRGLAPKGWMIPKLEDYVALNDFYSTSMSSRKKEKHLKKALSFIERLRLDFENTKNDSLFIANHSDDFDKNKPVKEVVDLYAQNGYNLFSQEEIEVIEKQRLGSVSEFNKTNEKFSFVKVVEQKEVEYVSMRYLLIDNTVYTDEKALVLADSILKVIKEQNNFSEMVELFSADPASSDRGGVYENFSRGVMVKEIEEFVFNNDVREIGVVSTVYGVAVVEVLDKKTTVRPVIVRLTKEIHTQAPVKMQLKDRTPWGDTPAYLKPENIFIVFPTGYRSNEGQFASGNELAMFWTQSTNEEGLVATVYLFKGVKRLEANYFDKEIGIAVRCLKQ